MSTRNNQSPPPVNMAVFNANYLPGRDYLIKPYQLADELPDHPSELPKPGKRIKCYECGYCQFSTVDITALAEHCRDNREHSYKYGETGVHPELAAIHPKHVERHQEKVRNILTGLPNDVELYDETAAIQANSAFTKSASPVAAKTPASNPIKPVAASEVKA